MMQLGSRPKNAREPTIALINVVFLLLVFFMIAGSIAPPLSNSVQLAETRDLEGREPLRGIVLLSDIRHPLKEFDRQMIDWAQGAGLPLHLLLTKADKLKRNSAHNAMAAVRRELSGRGALETQLFSATAGIGLGQIRERLDSWLEQATH